MPNLYIISGCNSAGKTTASYTVLPELLNCNEFVNADNIAAGLSPFQPESVAVEAGKIALRRANYLLQAKIDFAFQITPTINYIPIIRLAKEQGYRITPMCLYLPGPKNSTNNDRQGVSKIENLTITKTGNTERDELTEKVLTGVNRALRKLVETAAANNESLVVGNKDGNPISVPAKELLKKLASPKSSPKERT